MTGQALFEKYIKERDYTGSAADVYAGLLETLLLHIGDAVFVLLEEAERKGMRLDIDASGFPPDIRWDEITVDMVILVPNNADDGAM